MRKIRQETNDKESLIVGRNGTHRMKAVEIWWGSSGTLFIDGIGRRNTILNAGLIIDKPAAVQLIKQLRGFLEHDPELCGCEYRGSDMWSCGHVDGL